MKKFLFLSALGATMLASPPEASAEIVTVNNYAESFDNVLTTPLKECGIVYWERLTSNYDKFSYTNPQTGGVDDGAYLHMNNPEQGGYYKEDRLVTPKLKGDVSFYLRKTKEDAEIFIYKASPNGIGGYRYDQSFQNNVIGLDDLEVDEWGKVTIPESVMGDGTQFALTLYYYDIDNMTAGSAEVNDYEAIRISSFMTDYENIGEVNLDGQSKMRLKANVNISNTGTKSLDGVDFDIVFWKYSQPYKIDTPIGTYRYNGTLGVYESAEFEIECDVTIPESEYNGGTNVPLGFGLLEKKSETSTALKTRAPGTSYDRDAEFYFYPYKPDLRIYPEGNTATFLGYDLQLGQGSATAKPEAVFTLTNNAKLCPATIVGLTISDGFELTGAGSSVLVLQPGESKDVTIKYTGSEVGVHQGTIKITTQEAGEQSINVRAAIKDPDAYTMNFDGLNELPLPYIADKGWKIETLPGDMARHEGDKALVQTSSACNLITPMLHFDEGGKFLMELAISENYLPSHKVSYSTDRINWTELNVFNTDQNDNLSRLNTDKINMKDYYSSFYFASYSVDMPQGDYYLQFNGQNVYVDEINGGKLVTLPVDLFVASSTIADKGTVNYPTTSTIKLTNLGEALTADAYSVALYVDGAEVAKAETSDFANAASGDFSIVYTPHSAGSHKAKIVVKAGDKTYETSEVDLNVSPETSFANVKAGTPGYNSCYAPVRAYADSQFKAEIIYPKEVFDDLASGDVISQIQWYGARLSGPGKPVKAKVYMENTNDSKPGSSYSSVDGMQLVLDGFITVDPSISPYAPDKAIFATALFSENFTYTGDNVRVIVVSYEDSDWSSSFMYDKFWTDDNYPSNCLYTDKNLSGIKDATKGMPAALFGKVLAVPTLSGKVTDAKTDEAIAGASVKIEGPNEVLYTATTAEDGSYSMDVYQNSLDYTISVTAEGYHDFSEQGVNLDGKDLDKPVSLKLIEAVFNGKVVDSRDNAPVAEADVTLVNGSKTLTAKTDADGKFTVSTTNIGLTWNVTVAKEGYNNATAQVTLNDGDNSLESDIVLVYIPTLSGKVTDAKTNAAIAGASVKIEGPEDVLYTATTAEDGTYAMTVLRGDLTYTMTVTAAGYHDFTEQNVKLDGKDLEKPVSLTLIEAVLTGKVVSNQDKAPLADADVKLVNGSKTLTAKTDADGMFTVKTTDVDLTWEMTVSKDGYYDATTQVTLKDGENTIGADVVLMYKTVYVKGKVTYKGEKQAKVKVVLTVEGTDKTYVEETNSDGVYIFMGIDAYRKGAVISADVKGYEGEISVDFGEETAFQAPDIELKKTLVNVNGRVVAGGQPLKGMTVKMESEDAEYTAQTESDGTFSFNDVKAETTYTLTISGEGYDPYSVTVEVKDEDLDLGTYEVTVGLGNVYGTDGLIVKGGNGTIDLHSTASVNVIISDLSGRLVKALPAFSGATTVSGLNSGVYIVNKVKVLVK